MNDLAERLKALSDPTRLRIVRLLGNGECCVCDLMAGLELPQSKISRHMTYLKNSGWVNGRRNGKWVYYSLAEPECNVQKKTLEVLRDELPRIAEAKADFERLEQYLKTKTESCSS